MTEYPDDPEWSVYAKLKRRLALLDSPSPLGWSLAELATEYGVTAGHMRKLLARLTKDGHALHVEGRWTGA